MQRMEGNRNTGLPDYAAERRLVSRTGLTLLIFYTLYFAVSNAAATFMYTYTPRLLQNSYYYYAVLLLPAYAVALGGLLLFGHSIPTTPVKKTKLRFSGFCTYFLVGITLIYAGSLTGSTIGSLIDGIFGGDAYAVDDMLAHEDIFASVIFVVLLGPAMEELVFRKYLCDRLARYGELSAVLMSGLLFGLFHGNFYQFFYATLLGMLFAYAYLKTGRIWVSYLLHVLINLLCGVVSTLVTELLGTDVTELLNSIYEGTFSEEMLEEILGNLPGLMLLYAYDFLVLSAVAGGVVMLILRRKRIRFAPGIVNLGEERFRVMWVNLGVILFCVFSAVIFALNITY